MSRVLLAGLFVFSLAIVSGCGGDAGGEAVKGESSGDSSGVTGMGAPGDKEGGNTLPPPPPLKVPAGEQ